MLILQTSEIQPMLMLQPGFVTIDKLSGLFPKRNFVLITGKPTNLK